MPNISPHMSSSNTPSNTEEENDPTRDGEATHPLLAMSPIEPSQEHQTLLLVTGSAANISPLQNSLQLIRSAHLVMGNVSQWTVRHSTALSITFILIAILCALALIPLALQDGTPGVRTATFLLTFCGCISLILGLIGLRPIAAKAVEVEVEVEVEAEEAEEVEAEEVEAEEVEAEEVEAEEVEVVETVVVETVVVVEAVVETVVEKEV